MGRMCRSVYAVRVKRLKRIVPLRFGILNLGAMLGGDG